MNTFIAVFVGLVGLLFLVLAWLSRTERRALITFLFVSILLLIMCVLWFVSNPQWLIWPLRISGVILVMVLVWGSVTLSAISRTYGNKRGTHNSNNDNDI